MSTVFCSESEQGMHNVHARLCRGGIASEMRIANNSVMYPYWVVAELSSGQVDSFFGGVSPCNETSFPSYSHVLSTSRAYTSDEERSWHDNEAERVAHRKMEYARHIKEIKERDENIARDEAIRQIRAEMGRCEDCCAPLSFWGRLLLRRSHKNGCKGTSCISPLEKSAFDSGELRDHYRQEPRRVRGR
jgi:hypothetical protein